MSVAVTGPFDQVEILVRLLPDVPVSSTEHERHFGALRQPSCRSGVKYPNQVAIIELTDVRKFVTVMVNG